MTQDTRIRQVMELINAETDPRKVKILAAELVQLLSDRTFVLRQKAALN